MPVQTSISRESSYFTKILTLDKAGIGSSAIASDWSHDGSQIAIAYDDALSIYDVSTGSLISSTGLWYFSINNIRWSPDGSMIAVLGSDGLRMWRKATGEIYLPMIADSVESVDWSPDSAKLVAISAAGDVYFWDVKKHKAILETAVSMRQAAWSHEGSQIGFIARDGAYTLQVPVLNNPAGYDLITPLDIGGTLTSIAWSPNCNMLAFGGRDGATRIVDTRTLKLLRILEGHTESVYSISWSTDSKFLVTWSRDYVARFWDTATWSVLHVIKLKNEAVSKIRSVSPHPCLPQCAIINHRSNKVTIWRAKLAQSSDRRSKTTQYTNAKVVLVGDSGVGKSGLALVLTGNGFSPTDSTHGRTVRLFDNSQIKVDRLRSEMRETLLWDMAGQQSYRILHQLHLNEVAVALIVFDGRSDTDPYSGIRHWQRALDLAQRAAGPMAIPLKKFLVAARADRGTLGLTKNTINVLLKELGADSYFETSAKEGLKIDELIGAIHNGIDWDKLPKVTSNELFQEIKAFLVKEKEDGRILSTEEDLYRAYKATPEGSSKVREVRAEFSTCIRLVESRDLIRRLSFGSLILLQPEVIDAYASALINKAKTEPHGLGFISEHDALSGDFSIPRDQRIVGREQERLLLIAMVEDLLTYEIAFREFTNDMPQLVFPSQFTRTSPDLPDPKGKAIIYTFQGPIQNIYATLVVRLSRSGLFDSNEMWKHAVQFYTNNGTVCGIMLREVDEGHAELTLFFSDQASDDLKKQFDQFINTHLIRRALSETVSRRSIRVCPNCAIPLTDEQSAALINLGRTQAACIVCGTNIPLVDSIEIRSSGTTSSVREMNKTADMRRAKETATAIIAGKQATGDFDVFLCHNSMDKEPVLVTAVNLKEYGLLPWLDQWELRPGLPWQVVLEEQISKIKAAAVFVGSNGLGPWQDMEQQALLREFVSRGCPVIPVILPNTKKVPELPIFLKGMMWVDMRKTVPNPYEALYWGITGNRPPGIHG